jgi:hypothetical protein
MSKTNTAFLVDLATGKSEPLEIAGYTDIRARFVGDVKGETLRELGENVYLRKWTAVDPNPKRRVAIYDAYTVPSLRRVDIPEDFEATFRNDGLALGSAI